MDVLHHFVPFDTLLDLWPLVFFK